MTDPVTWAEIEAALGTGEARRVAEERWNRVITHVKRPFETALQEDAPMQCFLVDCLVRAELLCMRTCHAWMLMEDWRVASVCSEQADRIRELRERLEAEVWR